MTTLVTGATGFLGTRVVDRLVARGEPVIAFDWANPSAPRPASGASVRYVRGDVTEMRDLVAALRADSDIRRIVHLAYIMGAEAEADPHLAMRVNVMGTVNMLEAARLTGVPRVVFTSSEAVYGPQTSYGDRPVREIDYCAPDALPLNYSLTKQLNEHLARKYAQRYGLVTTALRVAVIHGHGRARGTTVWASHFASLPACGRVVTLPFPGNDRMCVISVDDAAEQLALLAFADRPRHPVYNSGGHSISGWDLRAAVQRILPDTRIEFTAGAPPQVFVHALDGTRLAEEFGVRLTPFATGVARHIDEARQAAGLPAVQGLVDA